MKSLNELAATDNAKARLIETRISEILLTIFIYFSVNQSNYLGGLENQCAHNDGTSEKHPENDGSVDPLKVIPTPRQHPVLEDAVAKYRSAKIVVRAVEAPHTNAHRPKNYVHLENIIAKERIDSRSDTKEI